jgi:predicted glycosyltransferase involved in capsule biosynthesis
MEQHKLGIIVPYRNREQHLAVFLPYINSYLKHMNIDYKIYIIEQYELKPFNRAKLLNIGFLESDQTIDYFIFHDVDMLPEDVDYSYENTPTHLACSASQFNYSLPYEGYFGGVTLFPRKIFQEINGFSNEYWGWGAEDDDILHRCKLSEIVPNRKCTGKIHSLNHDRIIGNNEYIKNVDRIRQMWTGNIDWKNEGLNSCDYTVLNTDENTERIIIKVEI